MTSELVTANVLVVEVGTQSFPVPYCVQFLHHSWELLYLIMQGANIIKELIATTWCLGSIRHTILKKVWGRQM